MPSPARRVRNAVNNRKRDLRRLVSRRIISQPEADYILQSYRTQKFQREFKLVKPADFNAGVFIGKNYE